MSQVFAQAIETGRVALYAVDVGGGSSLTVYSICGWTGAHQHRGQASRTSKLLEAIAEEIHL